MNVFITQFFFFFFFDIFILMQFFFFVFNVARDLYTTKKKSDKNDYYFFMIFYFILFENKIKRAFHLQIHNWEWIMDTFGPPFHSIILFDYYFFYIFHFDFHQTYSLVLKAKFFFCARNGNNMQFWPLHTFICTRFSFFFTIFLC